MIIPFCFPQRRLRRRRRRRLHQGSVRDRQRAEREGTGESEESVDQMAEAEFEQWEEGDVVVE